MKNRKWILIVSLVLAMTMSLTGTLAYLTDTDEAVNVMVLGNVDIEQLENGDPEGFSQGSPLYPAYYDTDWKTVTTETGAVDKKVTVKNVGNSAAFVRTVFAFEAGNLTANDYQNMIHLDTAVDLEWTGETTEINEEKYYLAYYDYPVAIQPTEETGASLVRIVMDKNAGNDLVQSFGKDYKVYVTSQAVQVTNLESLGAAAALKEAFGEINNENNPWVGGVTLPEEPDLLISSVADLKAFAKAVNDGNTFSGKIVALGTDLNLNGAKWTPIGNALTPNAHFEGTFDGQGHSISNFVVNEPAYAGLFGNIRSAYIKNLTVKDAQITSNHYVGGISGVGICGKFINCHVVNCTLDCNVEQTSNGWDNGDKVGGIVGYLTADGGPGYVKDCSVTNTTVEGYRQIGGIAGYAQSTNVAAEVKNCTVFAVTTTQELGTDEQNYKKLTAGQLIGDIVGDKNDKTVLDNNSVKKGLVISTADELFAFAKSVNEGKKNFSNELVVLADDIDLKNQDWEPIGQTGRATFNGVFDGQNYTISNLSVDSEAETGKHYSSGLFGWVESHSAGHGHIKNVNIENATIKGHHNVGALVGYITQETALVENCHVVNANISCTHANDDADGDKAGALIGNATVATPVKNCTAKDSTVSSGRDAGQVIGAGKEANVTGCSATNVTVTHNGGSTGANIRNEVIGRLL